MKAFAFTGTRQGLTATQHAALEKELLRLRDEGYGVAHNGSAIGADLEAALLCRQIGFRIVAHPSSLITMTAEVPSDELREKAGAKKRDRAMVQEAELLIACPGAREAVQGSGTWYTIGYAERRGLPVRFVWPDGAVTDGRNPPEMHPQKSD